MRLRLNGLAIPQEALKADSFACLLGLEESTSHRLHFEGHWPLFRQSPIHDISPSCRSVAVIRGDCACGN